MRDIQPPAGHVLEVAPSRARSTRHGHCQRRVHAAAVAGHRGRRGRPAAIHSAYFTCHAHLPCCAAAVDGSFGSAPLVISLSPPPNIVPTQRSKPPAHYHAHRNVLAMNSSHSCSDQRAGVCQTSRQRAHLMHQPTSWAPSRRPVSVGNPIRPWQGVRVGSLQF